MRTKSELELEFVRGQINPRIFTYDQLVSISDANYEVLNRSIDPMKIDKNDTFVLLPVLIHRHAFGEPVDPHLRVYVVPMSIGTPTALQDLTFEQFETGKEAA